MRGFDVDAYSQTKQIGCRRDYGQSSVVVGSISSEAFPSTSSTKRIIVGPTLNCVCKARRTMDENFFYVAGVSNNTIGKSGIHSSTQSLFCSCPPISMGGQCSRYAYKGLKSCRMPRPTESPDFASWEAL